MPRFQTGASEKYIQNCDMPGLSGWMRKVDLLGRSLPFDVGSDPAKVWHAYLGKPKSKTASFLA
jgi:hypothetical protein